MTGRCEEDFNQMCPQGWRFDAANGCVAPSGRHSACVLIHSLLQQLSAAGYDGPCVLRKRFALDAVAEKQTFGVIQFLVVPPSPRSWAQGMQCAVQWPCRGNLQRTHQNAVLLFSFIIDSCFDQNCAARLVF